MEAFHQLTGIAAPLAEANVDTDKILAGRFLKTITREGLGENLFWPRREDPSFVLNLPPWDDAKILIALENFGCGSSREHAPWALLDFGIRCVIAPQIADIFHNNCFKNGILPIVLPRSEVERLLLLVADPERAMMTVDLVEQMIVPADGRAVGFAIDAQAKADLMEGADEIDRTIKKEQAIDAFEARQRIRLPWMWTETGLALEDEQLTHRCGRHSNANPRRRMS